MTAEQQTTLASVHKSMARLPSAYMLRRYCPPTSNSASVICPSEQQRTASISTSNTLALCLSGACWRAESYPWPPRACLAPGLRARPPAREHRRVREPNTKLKARKRTEVDNIYLPSLACKRKTTVTVLGDEPLHGLTGDAPSCPSWPTR